MNIPVIRLDKTLPLPAYASDGDAGMDLRAADAVTVGPGQTVPVPTGVAMAIPASHVGLIHPRSGLAARHGITVLNAPGTIDSGYRGEIKVLIHNTSGTAFTVNHGDRIAQMVVQEFAVATLTEVETLPESDRGAGGFGSTGVRG